MSSEESEKEPSGKKPRKNDDFLQSIKKRIQSEIIKDIIVGSVEVESWQGRCEIVPGVFIDLLNPDISGLPLTISPFGYKKETLIDLEVRNCKEVSLLQCDKQLRILGQRIVGSLEKYCEPYKLVVYEEGGHFKQHTDTPEKDLSESVVVHLPTECEGGALMFNSWNPMQHYTANSLNYIQFNINHPHRVTHVSKGKRISLLYKVYNVPQGGCKKVISGEHCYSKIAIPKSFKNVLFTYPNKKIIKELLTQSNLEFKEVYYDYDDLEPEVVYDNIESWENLVGDPDERLKEGFEGLTAYATKYVVEDLVDVGNPVEVVEKYSYRADYTGNAGYSSDSGEIEYFVGYLVNPQKK